MSDEIKPEPTITESLESITRSIENFIGLQSAAERAIAAEVLMEQKALEAEQNRLWDLTPEERAAESKLNPADRWRVTPEELALDHLDYDGACDEPEFEN